MSNILFFYNIIFLRIVLQKLTILNKKNLNFFKKLELRFFFNDLKDNEQELILNFLSILEILTGQKAYIFLNEFKYIGSTKKYFFGCKVTLRRTLFLNFLKYFYFILSPMYIRKYGLFLLETRGFGNYHITLKDYTSFYNITLPIMPIPLEINFQLNAIKDFNIRYFLNYCLFNYKTS